MVVYIKVIIVIACLNLSIVTAGKKEARETQDTPLYNVQEKVMLNLQPWPITDSKGKLFLPNDDGPMIRAAKYLNMTAPNMARGDKYKLIVDVGLGSASNLLCLLLKDPSYVLIGFEANIHTYMTARVDYQRQYGVPHQLQERYELYPTGVWDSIGYAEYRSMQKENSGRADDCGGLGKSRKDAWWCSTTNSITRVPIMTLKYVLDKLDPSLYDYFYLKVDIENSDHHVLYGTGIDHLKKFQMVTIECRPDDSKYQGVEDACNQTKMTHYMMGLGFSKSHCNFEDCHFAKTKLKLKNLIDKLFKLCHSRTDVSECHWYRELLLRNKGKRAYQPQNYTLESAFFLNE